MSPCLFNLYSEYIIQNAWLDEAPAGIKISVRNINNLRYADSTTLMAESKEKVKSLLKLKEKSEEVGLKLNIQKAKIMAYGSISSWQINGETMEIVGNFIFWTSLVAQMVKRLSTTRETLVRSLVGKIPWRRKWQSTPVLLPGKSHGQRSLVGYSPWGRKESDTTEQLN